MRSRASAVLCCLSMMFFSRVIVAGDLEKAPPNFRHDNRLAVFSDFSSVDLNLSFDAANKTARGQAIIEFEVAQAGMPIFDLIPAITSVRLDGSALQASDIYTAADPNGQSTLRILGVEVQPGETHRLEISYDLTSKVTFSNGTIGAGFFMSDLDDREYFEQYAPTNYEYDQYKQMVAVEVLGSNAKHEIFANGRVQQLTENKWIVEYPDYFTTSSFYFHLASQGRFKVVRSTYIGLNAEIPLTVYAVSQSNASRGMDQLKEYLAELEGTYGAFAHESFTAYITDGGGGMEYCGATVTSLWALGHETTHSWFARGVMPTSGNSGWIDEAIASWRDDNYPRGNNPVRSPRNLAGFSPYKRFTTMDAYSYGADLISDFDGLVARSSQSGMKGVLKDFFGRYQRQTITVPMFQMHMEGVLGRSLQEFFNRFIYGKASSVSEVRNAGWDVNWSRHPRPFTKEELVRLR